MRKILLLLFAVLLTALTASAHSFVTNGIYYNIVSNTDMTCEVTHEQGSNNSYSGVVHIPETVQSGARTYRVIGIGDEAFYNSTGLTGVTLPSSVTYLSTGAFKSCTNLEYLTLPPNLTSIGGAAFHECKKLSSVTIPSSVTSIGNYAFYLCTGLWELRFSEGLTTVGDFAFSYSGLRAVQLPNSVVTIGQGAFQNCSSLTSVSLLGGQLTSIGTYCFWDCPALVGLLCYASTPPTVADKTFQPTLYTSCELVVPRARENTYKQADYWSQFAKYFTCDFTDLRLYYNIISETDRTVEVTYKDNSYNSYSGSVTIPSTVEYNNKTYSVTRIGTSAFRDCTGLTSVTIPSSVTTIDDYAFQGCSNLTSLDLPPYLEIIDEYVFRYCTSLTSIVIPNTVTSIGRYSFYGCTSLTDAIIGNGVTEISYSVFRNCSALQRVTIFSGTHIFPNVFTGCDALTEITCWATTPPYIYIDTFASSHYSNAQLYVPVGKKSAYQSANIWSNFTNMHELAANFVVNGIFYKITSTSPREVEVTCRNDDYNSYSGSVTIPSTVTYGGSTYRVTRIGDEAFYNCAGLTSVTIPSSVTSIGSYAFSSCTGLTSLTIPSSVTYLGESAFGLCTGLTSVTVPASVTDMGAAPFAGCDGLTTLKVASGNPVYSTPNNCNAIIRTSDHALINGCNTTVIPNNVTAIETGAFYSLPSLTSIAIPSSVTSIGRFAFAQCTGLTSVTFPSSVIDIGDRAFQGCTGLTSVKLPSSLTAIGADAFQGCTGLTSVKLPSSLTAIGADAFQGCILMSVTCLAQTPPGLANEAVFDLGTYANATLNVPSASVSAYQDAFGWSNFAHVTVYTGPVGYACYTPSNTTLTFYYDDLRSTRTGTTYDLNRSSGGIYDPVWYTDSTCRSVTKVVFNSSFADARPTTTHYWFRQMRNLTSITGLNYLNTENVKSMLYMFENCSSLTSLDLSSFNTANVQYMYNMFSGCSGLTSLDVSNFNTANVVKMDNMFAGCSGLTSLDVSNFNTARVTNMRSMFNNCSGLTSLDLSNFNTAKVTDMLNMFRNCSNLRTIYAGSEWSTDAVTTSTNMFQGCTSLVGGQGTTHDANHVDATYAHIDGGSNNPGYFTAEGAEPWHEPEAYACYTPSNTTLTFYYDNQRSSREGTTYDLNTDVRCPDWVSGGTNASVTKVVFNSTFADARPTSTFYWFYDMANLTNITGISYLKTNEVTNMGSMFYGCNALTSLDLSSFNTANVTDMSYMFTVCNALTSLDLSNFNTANVTNMNSMFYYCNSLTSLDLSNFNTTNVTDMNWMFNGCIALTSLDLSSFNTANVTKMINMFYGCYSLTSIYVGNEWSTVAVTRSSDMFLGCTSLVGGQGTTYDANHVDATYAHIDGGSNNPGYFTAEGAEPWHEPEAYACYTPSNTTLTFYYDNQRSTRTGTTYDLNVEFDDPGWFIDRSYTSVTHVVFDPSFADARPVSTCSWFWGMTNLQSITGMDCMNTEDVTTMWGMFSSCSSLTTLDLSSFNTSQVTNMLGMFSDCSNLTTIYAGSGWSTATVTTSGDMFKNCTSLVGGMGTTFDPSHTNKAYARIDEGPSRPGYFSEKTTYVPGDVSGDQSVNIADVASLIDLLLMGGEDNPAADCNLDGNLNVSDLTSLIDYLLSGAW